VIPALVKSGIGVNAADGFGLTPLMYAATIDFGDAESVRELLKAGADRAIKDFDGRTALEHARHYRHSDLATALR
jgi:ankyrin repeat protein